MAWENFKTSDFILGKIIGRHGLVFACHIENRGYWKNIHNDAVLCLEYSGNSYTAFYNADYFSNGVSYE